MAAISNNSITKHELRSQLNILGKTKLEKKKCYHKEQKLFILNQNEMFLAGDKRRKIVYC